jgi:hypothetical protein
VVHSKEDVMRMAKKELEAALALHKSRLEQLGFRQEEYLKHALEVAFNGLRNGRIVLEELDPLHTELLVRFGMVYCIQEALALTTPEDEATPEELGL